MKQEPVFTEQHVETASYAAIFNMNFAIVGAILAHNVLQLPSEFRLALFWAGVILMTAVFGYLVQKHYEKARINFSVLGLGIVAGLLLMIVSSPIASIIFSTPPDLAYGLQAGLDGTPSSVGGYSAFYPAIVASFLALLIAFIMLIKRH